jgi:alpha-L-fucosidase
MGLRSFYVRRLYGYLLRGLVDNALPAVVGELRNARRRETNAAVLEELFGAAAGDPERPRQWWEKPGLGLMFQIEARPGWRWQRNFDRFNDSLKGPDGSLQFPGPHPRVEEWVALSRRIGCDYHMFESKWHDGICYWDTAGTRWKTPEDYCRRFAEESRAAEIPYGFYYSAVFDHNPDFDDIQPLRRSTGSHLAMRGGKRAALRKSLGFTQFARLLFWSMDREIAKSGVQVERPTPFFDDFELNDFTTDRERYVRYVLDQLDELCGEYGAQVLWADWFGPRGDAMSEEIMDFMQERHPRVALTFNISLMYRPRWAHYLCSESHGIASTWRQVSRYRRLRGAWELVSPAASNWDAPQPKRNPVENAVTAAMILAAGGKVNFGVASEMDGSLRPELVEQLEALGEWYRPRKSLFVDAVPMRHAATAIAGVRVRGRRFRHMGTEHRGDRLIHVFDLGAQGHAAERPLRIELSGPEWENVAEVRLEPSGRELELEERRRGLAMEVPAEWVDCADTIVRVRRRGAS